MIDTNKLSLFNFRCQSPNSSLVRRTIDLNYANKQRAASLKWLFINGALLAVLTYDL